MKLYFALFLLPFSNSARVLVLKDALSRCSGPSRPRRRNSKPAASTRVLAKSECVHSIVEVPCVP